jgi:hypothetical protein
MSAADRDIRLEEWSPEILAGKDHADAIAAIYAHVEAAAASSMAWYAQRKLGKAAASRALRALAILLTITGGLMPIIHGIYPQAWIAQLGFALLALAAGAVAADRYFGISSGWIRYVTAMLAIQRALADFHLDWSGLLLSVADDGASEAARLGRFLDRARQFQHEVLKVVDEETQAWVAEFQSSLADLEKTLAAQKDAARAAAAAAEKAAASPQTGGIAINLSAAPTGEAEVSIDEHKVGAISGQQFGTAGVTPGLHVVAVAGIRDAKPFRLSTTATVKPGEITSVSFQL